MWISANYERIRYTGRIDWSVEGEPVWVFPGSSAEFWFSGEVLRIHVENFNEYWQNYLGCILDQVQSAFYLKKFGETVIEVRVPENESGVHHVLFFKRQDGCHELKILGFEPTLVLIPYSNRSELSILIALLYFSFRSRI